MANVIRQDVVQIGFETNLSELKKITKMVDELKESMTGTKGKDALDDLKDGANGAVKPLEKVKKAAKEVADKVTDIGKKAAKTAFNGLKKLASVSFKALAVGVTAAATAIGALVTKATKAFANYQQLVGGVETLFGAKGAKSVEEYAKIVGKPVDKVKKEYEGLKEVENTVLGNSKKAYKTAGLSANQYMETVTGFSASLIQSTGGDTKKAAELADMAIVDMSDNANKMGTSMESITYAYQGFAKQNYTMLDNLKLGYGGTKEEMKRLVKDAAKMDKSIDANSLSYANIVKAIHAVQENLYITGTTQAEAEKTVTGSLNSMKASWENLLTAVGSGEGIDEAIKNMVDSAKTFGKNIIPVVERALGGLGTVIEQLAPIVAEELPALAKDLLPPLISATVSLTKGLIKALPNIIKSVAEAVVDVFGEQFPIIKKIGDFFANNADKIGDAIKKIIPIAIALAAAFKGFKAVSAIGSLFGGKGGEGGKKGGFLSTLSSLAKMKTTEVLKGMANLGIIIGGFVVMSAVLMLVAPLIAKLGGFMPFLQLVVMIGILGLVGVALAKFGQIAGKVPVATVAKGLANMAIMLAGLSVLYLLIGAISLIKFDLGAITKIVLIIGLLGTVGTVLTLFSAVVGLIPIPVVLMGLANMAIVIAGMSALFLLIGACSLLKFNLDKMTKIIKIIFLLGSVGSALALFAGVIGLIPIPVVLAGLANLGLVLGGVTALIAAFGKLSESKGFVKFIDKGGELLQKVFKIIGGIAGSLIGGFGETMSESLPVIGKNIGEFGKNIKPLFDSIGNVDMGGVGTFFKALVSLLGVATGNEIVQGIKSLFGGDDESVFAKLGTDLCDFATNSEGFFTMVKAVPKESFEKAKMLFESFASATKIGKNSLLAKISDGSVSLATVGSDLASFSSSTTGFFTQLKEMDIEKLNSLWESLKTADDVTTSALTAVNDNISDIIKKVSEMPEKMGNAFKEGGDSLSTAIVEVWKDAVEASVAPVNKLLSGANHILKEFGSKKQMISWEPYARGTNGHRGGNALVNDGRGAELVQMPNGNAFIPRGRNVLIPNAPKGMKVLSAERTAKLMGRKSPIHRYANGVGDFDVWSYIDNAGGLVSKVTDGISYGGMSGFVLNLGKGMVSTFSGAMTKWIEKLFEEEGALSLADYVASKGVSQWRSTVIRALKMEGQYSAANVARTLHQMQTESGGNPRAINLWDSNAKKGIPSKGLMQVIDPTFKAYARAGFSKNIYDPLSNILASIRYAVSRYGSLARAYRGVGYANGGIATRPSIFGEAGPEMAIPLSASKRSRGIGLWAQTGEMLGVYTPERDAARYSKSTNYEENVYSPVFNLTISGTGDDRAMARKVKRWVAESVDDMFTGMANKNKPIREA